MQKFKLWIDIARDMKWVYGLFQKYILRVCAYGLIDLIRTFVALYITYSIGTIVDLLMGGDTQVLVRFAIFIFVWVVVDIIVGSLQNQFNAKNYMLMQKSMFMKLFKKTLDADWEHLTLHHSGDLLTRISKDVTTVTGNTNGLIPTILSNCVMILGAFAVIVYYDPILLGIIIVLIPFVLITTRMFMGKSYREQEKRRVLESDIMAFNKEVFHNIQAVKAFDLGQIFEEKMNEKEDKFVEVNLSANKYSILSWAVTRISGVFAAAVCVGWIIYRIRTGYLSYGNVTSMAAMALRIATAASALFGLMPTILEFSASTKRVREILAIPEETRNEQLEDTLAKTRAISEQGFSICVNNISFHYLKGTNVFEDAGMYAKSGEIIALVGPSGEGKTTMLRILLGIIRVQKGESVLQANSGEKIPMGTDTRKLIAYVPQGNTMMSGTIAENMRWIKPDATDEEIIEALKASCAYDFVEKLPDGIYHNIGESGLGFSEGQNQRLAIARAVLRKTPILLLDEATSALDVVTERKVLANLMEEEPNRITILTTHRPSALNMCNRVYRISDKNICEIGEAEITELMNEF